MASSKKLELFSCFKGDCKIDFDHLHGLQPAQFRFRWYFRNHNTNYFGNILPSQFQRNGSDEHAAANHGELFQMLIKTSQKFIAHMMVLKIWLKCLP